MKSLAEHLKSNNIKRKDILKDDSVRNLTRLILSESERRDPVKALQDIELAWAVLHNEYEESMTRLLGPE